MGPAAELQSVMLLQGARDSLLTQGNTLAETNDEATGDESTDTTSLSKRLHESCNDDENTTDGHADLSSSKVRNRATQEETTDDRTHLEGLVFGVVGAYQSTWRLPV